jgi:two-component system response regulator AtoC
MFQRFNGYLNITSLITSEPDMLDPPDLETTEFHGMVTVAPKMHELFERIEKAARDDTRILVRGETGTGKELVARALHRMSDRSKGPFRTLNCATLTGDLLASELFGHKEGAFTGAIEDRTGLFEQADGGTLFLDEVAELPLDLQARLLRVLEQQKFVPLGAQRSVSVDVRLVSATHRSLRRAVDVGEFRQDLMYRIRVVPLFLPRLEKRTGDVEALTWHFVSVFNQSKRRTVEGIEPETMRLLETHHWPGNVRELENVLEYAYVLGEGEVLTPDELVPELRDKPPPHQQPQKSDAADDAAATERDRILEALEATDGHRGEAADRLDVSRTTLWRKMKEYDIE